MPRKAGLTYPEAYRLMLYRSIDKTEQEELWNSRDGPVPYIILSRTGKQLFHVEWHNDKHRLNHKLQKGDRYFASITKKRALFMADKFVNEHWKKSEFKKVYNGLSRKEIVFLLAKEYYGNGNNPCILVHGKKHIL